MRGSDERSGALFSYVDLEARVPAAHPLRTIRVIVNEALAELSPTFTRLYAPLGRPSIPPEQLLRALLLQAFYSIRSERQLMERLDFDLLFRWFVGLGIDDPVWDHSTFSKNRDRLLAGDVAAGFLATLLDRPTVRGLLSSEHFSVDGSLIQAWASMKSLRPKDGDDDPPGGGRNPSRDFRGERRSNATHASTTDPDALLYRKGPGMEARLCFVGHVLMENRSGLVVDAELTRASGHAERLAALAMLDRLPTQGPTTLGADRGFDARDSSWSCASAGSRRTSRRTPAAVGPPSTAGRRAIRAMRTASGRGSGSRTRSAGSRRSPGRRAPACAVSTGCAGRSPSRPRRTTWSACPN